MRLGAVFHEEGLYPCVFYALPGYVIYELIIQVCRDHVLPSHWKAYGVISISCERTLLAEFLRPSKIHMLWP